jgi:ABC-2 type transport system ATP-binding protein
MAGNVVGELRNVHKAFGRHDVLRGLSFQLRRGEVVALLGRNGAGKTTAIGALLGLWRVSSGSVSVFGQDPRSDAVRQRVGCLFQQVSLYPLIYAEEALELFGSYYQRRWRGDLLTELGLQHKRRVPFHSLSGGERQRLGVALALMNDPDLVVLDEPATALDADGRVMLRGLIHSLRTRGRTILMATHDAAEIQASADRLLMIDDGRVVDEQTMSGPRARVPTLEPPPLRAHPQVACAEEDAARRFSRITSNA